MTNSTTATFRVTTTAYRIMPIASQMNNRAQLTQPRMANDGLLPAKFFADLERLTDKNVGHKKGFLLLYLNT